MSARPIVDALVRSVSSTRCRRAPARLVVDPSSLLWESFP